MNSGTWNAKQKKRFVSRQGGQLLSNPQKRACIQKHFPLLAAENAHGAPMDDFREFHLAFGSVVCRTHILARTALRSAGQTTDLL